VPASELVYVLPAAVINLMIGHEGRSWAVLRLDDL